MSTSSNHNMSVDLQGLTSLLARLEASRDVLYITDLPINLGQDESEEGPHNAVQKYQTLDEKVDLLIERMTFFLDIVNKYREYFRKQGREDWDDSIIIFADVKRPFSSCIQELRENQRELGTWHFLPPWTVRYRRAKAIYRTCYEINEFHNHYWRRLQTPDLKHIRDECMNLMRIHQNLYPKEDFFGSKRVISDNGALIKWCPPDTNGCVIAGEDNWKTECVICMERVRDIVLYPCKHFCLCVQCSENVFKCPLCKQRIQTRKFISDVKRRREPFIVSKELNI
jgi:hypothetical protein